MRSLKSKKVLINFKICDNAAECSGIEACPVNAFYWDKKDKKLAVDDSKCILCGKCECCPVDAIYVVKNEREHKKIKKEIDQDSRKRSDLFIDRYGAHPIMSPFLIKESDFESDVVDCPQLVMLEVFTEDSIECLLYSIPINKLLKNFRKGIEYRKMEIKKNSEFIKEYNVKEYPSLIFFNKGKLVGKVNGYYALSKKRELIKEIKKIVK